MAQSSPIPLTSFGEVTKTEPPMKGSRGLLAAGVELRSLEFIRRICQVLLSIAFIPTRVVVHSPCLLLIPLQE
jgi:hypothetical protein